MLNLDETVTINSSYNITRDLYLQMFGYGFPAAVVVSFVRAQVPEIDLLQLIPGYYLLLIFSFFAILVTGSDLLLRIAPEIDGKKSWGTKTYTKMQSTLSLKYILTFASLAVIFVFNIIFPLSLDSFNSFDGETLENTWSYYDVNTLETALLFILISTSQFPVFGMLKLTTEKDLIILPEYWKIVSIIAFVLSGILTPTVDGYTQLNFAFSGIFLYFFLIFLIQKRLTIKLNGISTLG